MLATRLILSQLNKIYLCAIKLSRVFYIETGILVYCLVYLEYMLVASSRELHFFPSQLKFALPTTQKQCNIKCCHSKNEIVFCFSDKT